MLYFLLFTESLPSVYYRLYSADQGAIFTQTPLDINDPSLSFIFADWAPPPYTVSNLKRYICNREQFHPSRAKLYLSRRDRLPALDYRRVDLLSSALRPGSSPERAIAIVIQLDKEGLGTAHNPLPIAYRCKKGTEEIVKTVMDATAHIKVKLAARFRKLREQKTVVEEGEKERPRAEEASESEVGKYAGALSSEPAEQERKEESRVLGREDAEEYREVIAERKAGREREVAEVTPSTEEAIRAAVAPSRSSSSVVSTPVVRKSRRLPHSPTYPPRPMIQRPRTSAATSGSVTSRSIQRRHTTANARPQGIRRSMIMMMPYLVHSSRG